MASTWLAASAWNATAPSLCSALSRLLHTCAANAWASNSSSLPSRLSGERGIDAVYLLTETAQDFFPRFGFITIERSEVPPALHESAEWTTACASTAQAMAKRLPAAP